MRLAGSCLVNGKDAIVFHIQLNYSKYKVQIKCISDCMTPPLQIIFFNFLKGFKTLKSLKNFEILVLVLHFKNLSFLDILKYRMFT